MIFITGTSVGLICMRIEIAAALLSLVVMPPSNYLFCITTQFSSVRVPKRRDSRVGWKRRARQQEKQNNISTLAAGCSK